MKSFTNKLTTILCALLMLPLCSCNNSNQEEIAYNKSFAYTATTDDNEILKIMKDVYRDVSFYQPAYSGSSANQLNSFSDIPIPKVSNENANTMCFVKRTCSYDSRYLQEGYRYEDTVYSYDFKNNISTTASYFSNDSRTVYNKYYDDQSRVVLETKYQGSPVLSRKPLSFTLNLYDESGQHQTTFVANASLTSAYTGEIELFSKTYYSFDKEYGEIEYYSYRYDTEGKEYLYLQKIKQYNDYGLLEYELFRYTPDEAETPHSTCYEYDYQYEYNNQGKPIKSIRTDRTSDRQIVTTEYQYDNNDELYFFKETYKQREPYDEVSYYTYYIAENNIYNNEENTYTHIYYDEANPLISNAEKYTYNEKNQLVKLEYYTPKNEYELGEIKDRETYEYDEKERLISLVNEHIYGLSPSTTTEKYEYDSSNKICKTDYQSVVYNDTTRNKEMEYTYNHNGKGYLTSSFYKSGDELIPKIYCSYSDNFDPKYYFDNPTMDDSEYLK